MSSAEPLQKSSETFGRDILLLVLAGIFTLGISLGQEYTWASREIRHALIAAEMNESRNFLVPRLLDSDYTYKPPAMHIPVALLYRTFGTVNLGLARTPSALAGLFTALCLYLLARKVYGRSAGLWAGIMLLASPGHIMVSRTARPDMLLTASLAASCLALVWALHENGFRRYSIFALAGLAGGFPVLCKGPYGAFFSVVWVVGAAIFFPIDCPGTKRPSILEWLLFLFFMPVIPLVWAIPAYQYNNGEYIKGVLTQYNPGTGAHARSLLGYMVPAFEFLSPWMFFAGCVVNDVRATVRKFTGGWTQWIATPPVGLGAFLFAASIFALLSMIPGKRDHYLAPWYPFAILVLAVSISRRQDVVWFRALTRALAIFVVLGIPVYFTLVMPNLSSKWQEPNLDREYTLKAIRIPERGALLAITELEEPLYWQNYSIRAFEPGGKLELLRVSGPIEGQTWAWPEAITHALTTGRPCYLVVANKDEDMFFNAPNSPGKELKLDESFEKKQIRMYRLIK